MKESQFNIDNKYAMNNNFDSVYLHFEGNKIDFSTTQKDDEFAIYDKSQILPWFIVKYRLISN